MASLGWLDDWTGWIKRRFRHGRGETRSLENPSDPLSAAIREAWGLGDEDGDTPVTAEAVAGIPSVGNAIELLADDMAKVPLNVYKRSGMDREKADDHPANWLINLWGQANEYTPPNELWFDWYWDALLFGEGFIWIERDGPTPIGLYRLLPTMWKPVVKNKKRYFVGELASDEIGRPQVLHDADVLYLRGPKIEDRPLCPIKRYRQLWQTQLAIAGFTPAMFRNGTQVGGILQAPKGANPNAIDNVEKGLERKAKRSNWFKTLVLRDGFTFQRTTLDMQEASVVELDEAQARHVCRVFRLPPSKLGLQGTVSYGSLEQENRNYYDSALSPRMLRGRSQINSKLILPSERPTHFVDYLINSLTWADAKARAEIAAMGIRTGWLLPDEVRRWDNLPPKPKEVGTQDQQPLNGAQLEAVKSIVAAIGWEQIGPEAAKHLLRLALPTSPDALLDELVTAAAKFTPKNPEVKV